MSGAIAEPQKAKANQTVSTFFSSQDVFELLLSLYIEKKKPRHVRGTLTEKSIHFLFPPYQSRWLNKEHLQYKVKKGV